MKIKWYWPILLYLAPSVALYSSEVDILSIPHPTAGQSIIYSIDINQCAIESKEIKARLNTGEMNILESAYFSMDTIKQDKNEIIFHFAMAKNILFTYKKKDECSFSLFYQLPEDIEDIQANRLQPLEKINIEYYDRLGVPTLKAISFESKNSTRPQPYSPFKLQGYLPFYEFNIGMAANIHSNIRPREKRRFNKDDPVIAPMPTFLMRYGPLFINNDGIGSVLVPLKYFSLLGAFILEGEPYRADHIRERKQSIYLGPLLKIQWLEAHYYKDIKGLHHGEVLKITLAPSFQLRPIWEFNPRVYWQYWDEYYNQYYFGVNDSEANYLKTSSYKPKHTYNYGFMFRNIFKIEKWSIVASTGIKFYGKEINASPITIKDHEFRLILGFLYNIL